MNAQIILLWIGVVSTGLFIIKTILMLIGVDGEADLDVDADVDVEADNSDAALLSVHTVLAFLMGLGWGSLMFINAFHFAVFLAVGLGCLVGLGFLYGAGSLMRLVKKLDHAGAKIDITEAIGKTGQVYLTIPKNGSGEVTVTVAGAQRNFIAKSADGKKIDSFAEVLIAETEGSSLVVTPV